MSLPIELLKTASVAKYVRSPLLNRMGVQVARTMLAHGIHSTRRVPLRAAATPEQLAALDEDGIVVIPDFLPASRFDEVRRQAGELLQAEGPATVYQHGPNRLVMRTVAEGEASAVRSLTDHPVVRDLFDWGERMTVDFNDMHFAVEELRQGPGDAKDLETDLHSDIFFNTHKGWLYLGDVTPENAPFVYVKGSHRLGLDLLRYEYEYSLTGNPKSRRVTREELERRGLVETVFEARANTLVIANVCGYHRRLRGVPGGVRRGVHFSHRRNPFLPRFAGNPNKLPGMDLLRKLRDGRLS